MLIPQLILLIIALMPLLPPGSEFPRSPEMNRFISSKVSIETDNGNRSYPYRILMPPSKEAPLPLVIFLHGAGERGADNALQLKYLPQKFLTDGHLKDKPCYLLAMQCPKGEWWAPFDARDEPVGEATPSMQAVIAAILKTVREENIDQSRIYLTGLSMGGFGSWDLAARHPDWFAAVVPICGGGQLQTAKQLVDVPIWAFHGTNDRVVAESESRMMIEAIRAAGGHPAYSALPGVRHNSWHIAYGPRGAMDWMFAQQNPTPPSLRGFDDEQEGWMMNKEAIEPNLD